MKVILTQDIKGRGKKGDVVSVSDGFARNFLFPKKLAEEVTAGAMNAVKIAKENEEKKKAAERAEAKAYYESINGATATVKVKCGEAGKLYGSVTTADVAEGLRASGFEVDKRRIVLSSQIKDLGVFPAEVKVQGDLVAKIKINVIKE